jgi:hypothetical protein
MEKNFSEQLGTLKSSVHPETQGKGTTQHVSPGKEKMEEEFKPISYDVSYSSVSSYKDGKRDVKEKFHLTNPESEVVAERIPGKDEFKVKKTLKTGDKPETKEETMSSHDLKRWVDT